MPPSASPSYTFNTNARTIDDLITNIDLRISNVENDIEQAKTNVERLLRNSQRTTDEDEWRKLLQDDWKALRAEKQSLRDEKQSLLNYHLQRGSSERFPSAALSVSPRRYSAVTSLCGLLITVPCRYLCCFHCWCEQVLL